ncbi:hypothetical protein ALP32_02427, partial [Pseudomonas avellanae]
ASETARSYMFYYRFCEFCSTFPNQSIVSGFEMKNGFCYLSNELFLVLNDVGGMLLYCLRNNLPVSRNLSY